MTVTAEDVQERARQALPYFQDARGEPGDPPLGSDESDPAREDFPAWVLKVEEAVRAETDADWRENSFYGLVAETLMDADEYGEHRWEEESITAEEMIDEIASDVSLPALNEELIEWARQSPEWSDVADELSDPDADDGEMELELIQEAWGDDIYRIRRAVLQQIYEQLLDEEETEA